MPSFLAGGSGGGTGETLEDLLRDKVIVTPNGHVCLICGKARSDKKGIRQHMADGHIESGYRYLCPLCKRVYKNKNSFTVHISITPGHGVLKGGDIEQCKVYQWAETSNMRS